MIMAVREHIPFNTAFEDAVRSTGFLTEIGSDATLKANYLLQFNRSYKIGYELPFQANVFWEDARTWAQIIPSSGLIPYVVLGDARNPRSTRSIRVRHGWLPVCSSSPTRPGSK